MDIKKEISEHRPNDMLMKLLRNRIEYHFKASRVKN